MAIFRLDCEDTAGQKHAATYDTGDNAVTIDGVPVTLDAEEDIWRYVGEKRKQKSSIKKLKIILGLKCNLSCAYCSQKAIRDDDAVTQKNVIETIKGLKAALPDAPEKVELWGGEPFVYWKTLKQAVPLLREQFPDCQIGIITNGTLLDDEKVDWIEDNGIGITISHDGVGQSNRGPDPLDDPKILAVWRRLAARPQGLAIAVLLTGNSYDPLKSRVYLEEKLGGSLNLIYDVVNDLGGWSPSGVKSLSFTQESLDTMTSIFLSKSMRSKAFLSWEVEKQMLIDPILCKDGIVRLRNKCGIGGRVHVINGKGELMVCQSNNKIFGSIKDIGKAATPGLTNALDRVCCQTCPFVHVCKGACPYEKGNAFVANCQAYFAYYRAVFAAVFEDVFGLRVKRIDGDMLRPVFEPIPTPKGKVEKVESIAIPWPAE